MGKIRVEIEWKKYDYTINDISDSLNESLSGNFNVTPLSEQKVMSEEEIEGFCLNCGGHIIHPLPEAVLPEKEVFSFKASIVNSNTIY